MRAFIRAFANKPSNYRRYAFHIFAKIGNCQKRPFFMMLRYCSDTRLFSCGARHGSANLTLRFQLASLSLFPLIGQKFVVQMIIFFKHCFQNSIGLDTFDSIQLYLSSHSCSLALYLGNSGDQRVAAGSRIYIIFASGNVRLLIPGAKSCEAFYL